MEGWLLDIRQHLLQAQLSLAKRGLLYLFKWWKQRKGRLDMKLTAEQISKLDDTDLYFTLNKTIHNGAIVGVNYSHWNNLMFQCDKYFIGSYFDCQNDAWYASRPSLTDECQMCSMSHKRARAECLLLVLQDKEG